MSTIAWPPKNWWDLSRSKERSYRKRRKTRKMQLWDKFSPTSTKKLENLNMKAKNGMKKEAKRWKCSKKKNSKRGKGRLKRGRTHRRKNMLRKLLKEKMNTQGLKTQCSRRKISNIMIISETKLKNKKSKKSQSENKPRLTWNSRKKFIQMWLPGTTITLRSRLCPEIKICFLQPKATLKTELLYGSKIRVIDFSQIKTTAQLLTPITRH